MIPFNPRGLFDAMGGREAALARLDAFFRRADGSWALRNAGGLHAQMSNEPSVLSPWLYMFAGRPDRAQETIRESMKTLWSDAPDGIPGNDDLGTMSAWYVFAAMGLYPYYPGRAELLLTAPLFPEITIARANGVSITIRADGAAADAPYITSVTMNGQAHARSWLTADFVSRGGQLAFRLSTAPDPAWGRAADALPPSFPPR
jgi:putative alpha-1,2-mannosidase